MGLRCLTFDEHNEDSRVAQVRAVNSALSSAKVHAYAVSLRGVTSSNRGLACALGAANRTTDAMPGAARWTE